MAILAGIDEAGFGPTLGPLVVSGVAFNVPDALLNEDFWQVLSRSCTKRVSRAGLRLPVADSKKLYHAKIGMAALERTALVMLSLCGAVPDTFAALLGAIAPGTADAFAAYPWYGGDGGRGAEAMSLPLSEQIGDLPTRANALRRDFAANEIEFLGVSCEPLPEGEYNRLVAKTRNKSVVLSGLAMRIMDRIVKRSDAPRIRIRVDRLGGRRHYRESLSRAFEGYEISIVEESEERSAYRLSTGLRMLEIDFSTKGDDKHFPVALASIYSKYVRELCMHRFNDYWCRQQPGLTPTAGYYTDAKRWLAEADGAIRRLGVERRMLVRSR